MKIEQCRKAISLYHFHKQAMAIVRTLNEINGGDTMVSIPAEVFHHVDRNLAAKGLLSLMVEAVADYERQLCDMGVEI